MARIGYARIGSVGQIRGVQLEKHQPSGMAYQKKKSGTAGKRASPTACLEYVQGGDTLVVMCLDRLASSTSHLCQITEGLRHQGVDQLIQHQLLHRMAAPPHDGRDCTLPERRPCRPPLPSRRFSLLGGTACHR